MHIEEDMHFSLLDYLAYQSGRTCLSDLRSLGILERRRLAREVEKIPTKAAAVREWNDALSYLTGASPEPSAESAREKLIIFLTRPQGMRGI